MYVKSKAFISQLKPHWQHKVVGRKITMKDGLEPRFNNDITIWIPKLTPRYPEPCCFFHVANKQSSAFLRTRPHLLQNGLQDLVNTLSSDKWIETWDRIQDISYELINNDLFLDDNYIDMDLFNRNIEAKFE